MNYIQEIKSFNDWLIINPSVSSDDIVLWYALMNLNNICGWQKEFTVAISTIIDRTRLSRSAIYRSRNKLVQMGRIQTKERGGNQCSVYEITPFSPNQTYVPVFPNGTQPGTHNGTQYGTQPGTQSGTIIKTKLKETKLNNPAGDVPGEQKKEVTLYWKSLVGEWHSFYEKQFSQKPTFGGGPGKCLKSIIGNLEKQSSAAGYEWSEAYALDVFHQFLQKAFDHSTWLRDNFLLKNIHSHYDAIINPKKNGQSNSKNGHRGDTKAKGTRSSVKQVFDERYSKS
jgi:hypothetical protein